METRPRRVVDSDFNSVEADILPRSWRERIGADEDATVAAFADFEIEREHKVFPLLSVDEHVVAGPMRIKGVLFNQGARPAAVAVHPTIGRLAIEEEQPAFALFLRCQLVIGAKPSCNREQR